MLTFRTNMSMELLKFTLCDTVVVLFMIFLDEIHCLQEHLPNIPGT